MITIIIPVYNVEDYISACIQSVISQSYHDFELIIVNDGSTDSSGEICNQFAEKDTRIKVFHKNNEGVSSARNLGLRKAHGEYITFIDSDDYIGPDYLSNLYGSITFSDADIVIGGYVQVWGDYNEAFCFKDVTLPNFEFSQLFTLHNLHKRCSPWGKLFKAKVIRENNLWFDERIHLGEDCIFVLTYLSYIKSATLISASEYYYLQREGSLTKKLNSFQSEFAGLSEFDKAVNRLRLTSSLNENACEYLMWWSIIFLDRVKSAILNIPNWKKIIELLRIVDWKRLMYYKVYQSPKERMLDTLLVKGHYNIFLTFHLLRKWLLKQH